MKLVQKRSKKTGLPPGTLVHIGEKKAETVTMTETQPPLVPQTETVSEPAA